MTIDLRSDTATHPTPGMRAAMAAAEVGDEQWAEDPTTLALERRVAQLLGQEAAMFVPTATMANQIALAVLTRPGDGLIAEASSHIVGSEAGGSAVIGGLMIRAIAGAAGLFTADDLERAVVADGDPCRPPTRVVALENTHSNGGGRVWPVSQARAVAAAARDLDVRVHLDGARLLNAAIAAGEPASAWSGLADTVTLCLSKGLGCPFGALLAMRSDLVDRARRLKQMLGGALRQSGVAAAAGLYALDQHVQRLAEDHANARRLAEMLVVSGASVDMGQVQTNCVQIAVTPAGLTAEQAIRRLREHGVLVSGTARPGVVRAVTHLDVTRAQVEHAAGVIGAVVGMAQSSPLAAARGTAPA